jgi:hypothetical protein
MSPRRTFAALSSDSERRAFLIDLGQLQLEVPKPAGYVENIDQLRYETGEKHLNDASPIPNRFLAHRETPLETRILKRGELEQPGEPVSPGIPEALAAGFHFPEDLPANRRRSVLAHWIASEKNLLTARVIANRVWQWHFGEGLVRTPNDFGIRGERPSHPELLDWLSSELIEHNWSLKHLHRVIMNSNAFQQAATADAATLERDPDNVLLARLGQNSRRLRHTRSDAVRAADRTAARRTGAARQLPQMAREHTRGVEPPRDLSPRETLVSVPDAERLRSAG